MKTLYTGVLFSGLLIQPILANDPAGGLEPPVELGEVTLQISETVDTPTDKEIDGVEVDIQSIDVETVEFVEGEHVEVQTLEVPVEEAIDPAVCFEGTIVEGTSGELPTDGELVDPAVCPEHVDGICVEHNSIDCPELILMSHAPGITERSEISVDGEVVGVVYTAEVQQDGEVLQDGEVPIRTFSINGATDQNEVAENTNIDPSIYESRPVQANFRTLTSNTAEDLSATAADVGSGIEQASHEQRGATRLFEKSETDVNPVKRGLIKLFGKKSTTTADKSLAQRLAEVDALRDKALASGDTRLLAQADRMEAQIRSSHKPAKSSMKTLTPRRN